MGWHFLHWIAYHGVALHFYYNGVAHLLMFGVKKLFIYRFPKNCVTKFVSCRFPVIRLIFSEIWLLEFLIIHVTLCANPFLYMEIISLKIVWQSMSNVVSPCAQTFFGNNNKTTFLPSLVTVQNCDSRDLGSTLLKMRQVRIWTARWNMFIQLDILWGGSERISFTVAKKGDKTLAHRSNRCYSCSRNMKEMWSQNNFIW